jgi:hypothetical protein
MLLSSRGNSIFIMVYRYHEMDVDYFVVEEMFHINVD